MKILATDQSTKVTGWAFYDGEKLAAHGLILAKKEENDVMRRIGFMCDEIESLVEKYKPDLCCIEQTQSQGNELVFRTLSMLVGSLSFMMYRRGLPYIIVYPKTWKAAFGVKGRKRAEQKANTIQIVRDRYGIEVSEDEADAIGLLNYAIKENTDGQKE